MDLLASDQSIIEIVGLYFINLVLIGRLFWRGNFITMIIWPIIIYSIGPLLGYVFAANPVLVNYIFPDNFLEETAFFTTFLILMMILDRLFCLDSIVRLSVLGPHIKHIGSLRLTRIAFFVTGGTCAVLQLIVMATYGSALTGQYLSETTGTDDSNSLGFSWGMLGGLYELFFSSTIVMFIAQRGGSLLSIETLFYISVLLLRLAGGTRLLLIKEVSILLFISMAQQKIRPYAVGLIAGLVILLGTAVGLARSNGAASEFGAFSSFAYESALDTLTLNIADSLSNDPNSRQFFDPVSRVQEIVGALVPTFIRNIFVPPRSPNDDQINPATKAGFSTISPVGGMNLFASMIYLFEDRWVGPIFLPILFTIIVKVRYNPRIKSFILMAFLIESLNTWRDPLELSLKLIVQTLSFYGFLAVDWNGFLLPRQDRTLGERRS